MEQQVLLPQRAVLYCQVSTTNQSSVAERLPHRVAEQTDYQVVSTHQETATGVKLDWAERINVLAFTQWNEIDIVLVMELSRWGRNMTNLLAVLKELKARRVSLVALHGMTFDLTTRHGRMLATLLACITEFD